MLAINRCVRLVFNWRCLMFLSISFFPLLLSKLSLFPAYHQTCFRKITILDLFTIGSSWNLSTRFETQFWAVSSLGITKRCQNWEKYSSHCNFSFSAETQSCLGKIMIPNSLSVGLSWNSDSFPHISTIGICKIMSVEGERCITHRTMEWRLQSLFLFSNVWEP